jgi:hypothetical protein
MAGGDRHVAQEPKTIHIPEDSELARVLEEVDETPLRLETRGVLYRVSRDAEDLWAGYDPQVARAGMAAAAGTLTPEDGERLKAFVYRAREEGSRSIDRP